MKEAVRERLSELFLKFGDLPTPQIVSDARKLDSPLHGEFEWDKSKAHEIYLLERARALIREFYIDQNIPGKEETVKVREYQSIVVEEDDGTRRRTYLPTREILKNPTYVRSMLEEALNGLSSWKKKYRSLLELTELSEGVEKLEQELQQAKAAAAVEATA